MKKLIVLITLFMLAACSGTPTAVQDVPTLAALPSLTPTFTSMPSETFTLTPLPSLTPTGTLPPTETFTPTFTLTPTDTASPLPTATDTPTETFTPTITPSETATETFTPTQTYTYTPSLTITNTITPTPSPSFTASPEVEGIGALALLSERATVLPPELMYNPATLTAVAIAGQTLVAQAAITATPTSGGFELATLPPPLVGGGSGSSTTCTTPLPGGLGAAFAADPTLTQLIGCPLGMQSTITSAAQAFERGSMVYAQGSPGSIYVLTLDGRFRRFDDTWVAGVDPETGGMTPPSGLLEPKRGFGKVWRNNPDVQAMLGWGVSDEQGASSSLELFERGRAIFLPQRGETYVLIDDPGGLTGSWRSLPVSF